MSAKKSRNVDRRGTGDSPTDPSNTEDRADVLAKDTETVEDNEATNCSHAKKYKPHNSPSKKGKQRSNPIKSLKCLDCLRDASGSVETQSLWLCLHCFETRCGRYTDSRHAVTHFESEKDHCLSMNVDSLQIWCYNCDNYISQHLVRGGLESTLHSVKEQLKKLKPPKKETHMEIKTVELPIGEVKNFTFRVIGLTNLGNTCYFNSALQNLLYLAPFQEQLFYTLHRTEYTLVPKKHPDLKPITFQYANNGATEPGDLTRALSSLMKGTKLINDQELVKGTKSANKRFVASPRPVQNVIARRYKKFSNGSQQDSHELLRYLIDIVKDEEIKRLKTAFLEHFNAQDHKAQFKNYPEDKKKLLRKYASEFKNIFVFTGTFIDDVFGGELLSIVECHSCRNTYSVNEDFLDLSLPLPLEKYDCKPGSYRDTKKQKKQFSKAEKKKLKKQDSKTYKKSDLNNTSKQDRELSRETPASNVGSESVDKGEGKTGTDEYSSPVLGSQGQSKESDKHLSKEMNGLNIETTTKPAEDTTNLEGEREAGALSDQIPEATSHCSLSGEGHTPDQTADPEYSVPSIVIDDSECRAETNSSQVDISSEELQSSSQTELQMEAESPDTTASCSDAAEQPIESKECTVKSKQVTRLRKADSHVPQHSSLEYYINKFFSAETLYGDYLCVNCNPQCLSGAEEDKESSSSGEGKEEKESSGESIDLAKCRFTDATKQFHVKSLPPILTIHLKRFSQSGFRLNKVNKHIDFPLVLDMGPYSTSDVAATMDTDCKILYGLRGIVQHSGGMAAGHYIAYVNIADWSTRTKIQSPKLKTDPPSGDNLADTTQSESMYIERGKETGEETGECRMEAATAEPAAEIQTQESTVTETSQSTTHIIPSEDWYYISDSSVSRVQREEVFRSQAYILFYERLPLTPNYPL